MKDNDQLNSMYIDERTNTYTSSIFINDFVSENISIMYCITSQNPVLVYFMSRIQVRYFFLREGINK